MNCFHNDAALTCQPPTRIGEGSVTINATPAMAGAYLQASVMAFKPFAEAEPKPKKRSSGGTVKGRHVRVAMLKFGADMGGHAFLSNETEAIADWMEYQTKMIKEHLEGAGRSGADLVVLPELFNQPEVEYGHTIDGTLRSAVCPFPEPADGSTLRYVREAAMKWRMNIVAPICELKGQRRYNAAFVINRDGNLVGQPYHKVYPTLGEEGMTPGLDGVGVYDLDFGKISILICFDINFAELWHEAYALGADAVIWPSAMNSTCDPTAPAYARLHQYHVVGVGYGDIISPLVCKPRPRLHAH